MSARVAFIKKGFSLISGSKLEARGPHTVLMPLVYNFFCQIDKFRCSIHFFFHLIINYLFL